MFATPHNAGLPGLPSGKRWKSKLITASGTFAPAVEAPNAYDFFRVVWGGGGGGGFNATLGGGQGQIFDTIGVIEITGQLTITIGAGGTANGGSGGNTTIAGTNLDGTVIGLHAYGARSGKQTYIGQTGDQGVLASGNPWTAITNGCAGRVNGVGARVTNNMVVSAGEGTQTSYDIVTGGYVCGQLPATLNEGCSGWRGRGGLNNGTTPAVGYSSGGGSNGAGTSTAGKQGFVELFWEEPI